jgi:hypothetical protein
MHHSDAEARAPPFRKKKVTTNMELREYTWKLTPDVICGIATRSYDMFLKLQRMFGLHYQLG